MCGAPLCKRVRVEGSCWCPKHIAGMAKAVMARADEYEAARIHDPERARWDVWDDGGLERPGEDEGW